MSEQEKIASARRALDFVEEGSILGVGTGSTVNHFISLLGASRMRLEGCVSSSEASTARLEAEGFRVLDLNHTGDLDLYIDGADEIDRHHRLIKGGGGALTREKIIAGASRQFICIADGSKCVEVLGAFPLPVEVIPLARSYVARQLVKLGGRPVWREGFVSDNDCPILDVHGLSIVDPVALETELNQIPGVVTVGLFARRRPDRVIVSGELLAAP